MQIRELVAEQIPLREITEGYKQLTVLERFLLEPVCTHSRLSNGKCPFDSPHLLNSLVFKRCRSATTIRSS